MSTTPAGSQAQILADLRKMEEAAERLEHTLDQARDAVRRAHEAASMSSGGEQAQIAPDAQRAAAEKTDDENASEKGRGESRD